MTPAEKLAQLNSNTTAIPRLGVPAFDYWTGCAHGVSVWGLPGREDNQGATQFPMGLALAATFDTKLMQQVATAIGDELRAKANAAMAFGALAFTNCWDPNINIFRDPRWGRGAETFGEDPVLTAQMASAFVRGVQWGNVSSGGGVPASSASAAAPRGFVKAGVTCKHFAAYSLEESEGVTRMEFDAVVDPRDLNDTYLPAFQACVHEGVLSFMCSYNAINGTPSCANDWLLSNKLRSEWKFKGFVVSDCDALPAISNPVQQAYAATPAQGVADALAAGTDLACTDYSPLQQALQQGLVSQKQVDASLTRLFTARMRQGHFDPNPAVNPYLTIPTSVVGSPAHMALARQAAAESVVLLKNGPPRPGAAAAATLPLQLPSLRNVTVIGPLANQSALLLGNYFGRPAGSLLSPWQVLESRVAAYNMGAGSKAPVGLHLVQGSEVVAAAVSDVDGVASACRQSDVCIFFLGTSMVSNQIQHVDSSYGSYDSYAPSTEGETLDRTDLLLPGQQLNLVQAAARRTNATVVVVLLQGGPLDVSWLQQSEGVGAVLTAWFPGQGAEAIADVLLGDVSPSGRLPVTFYFNNYTGQISMSDMRMRPFPGRTHRFLQVPVLYPFGHGLSYATFQHALAAQPGAGAASAAPSSDWLDVAVNVTNVQGPAADDAVLLFLSCSQPAGVAVQAAGGGSGSSTLPPLLTLSAACQEPAAGGGNSSADGQPVQTLVAFDRTGLVRPGQSRLLRFRVLASNLAAFATSLNGTGPPPCGRYWLRAGTVAAPVDVQSGSSSDSGSISTQSAAALAPNGSSSVNS